VNLTILIPSFEGFQHLEDTIKSVKFAASRCLLGNIRIRVADNGSSSFAASRIKDICLEQDVHLTRFEENLGYDSNIQRAISLVETSHVWMLGDDDILAQDALGSMCGIEGLNDFDFILAPPRFFADGSYPSSTLPTAQALMPFNDAADLLKSTLWASSALSSHIWNVSTLRNIELDEFKGSDWVHFAALSMLSGHRVSKVGSMNPGLVFVRVGVSRWETNFGSAYISGLKQIDVIRRSADESVFATFRQARYATNLHDAFFLTAELTTETRKAAADLALKTLGRTWRMLLLDIPALYAPSSLKYVVLHAGKFAKKLAARLRKWMPQNWTPASRTGVSVK
jgi:glycosyltransferase involved in cell wall biosynthesis